MIENICKHNKFGFCKFGDKCQFRHINDLCLSENCIVDACENRHPKFCYYQKNYGRCKFTTFCKYSHEKEKLICENKENISDFRQRLEEKELQIANLENRLILLENDQNEEIKKLTTKIMRLEEIQSTKINCDQCNHTPKLQDSLNQPSVICQNKAKEIRLYSCEYCEFTSIHRDDMAAHIDTHTADSEGDNQYTCNQCSFVANFRENVYEHIRAHHEIEKDFEDDLENECFSCDKCDYETIFQENLLVHECDDTVARYKPLKSYSCNQCNYETLFQENMEGHLCEE